MTATLYGNSLAKKRKVGNRAAISLQLFIFDFERMISDPSLTKIQVDVLVFVIELQRSLQESIFRMSAVV